MKRVAIGARSVAGFTGLTTTVIEHARRFAAAGWDVDIFAEKLAIERIDAAGAHAHRIRRWPVGRYSRRRMFAERFDRSIHRFSFDLVRGHGDLFSQDVLCLHNCVHAAHEAIHGRPLAASSDVGRIHSRVLSEQSFELMIANSRLMKDDVMARFGIPQDRIAVIHPGHDPRRFRPDDRAKLGAPLREALGVRGGELLIGLITSGDFEKRGVALFLTALARLDQETQTKIRVLVMGKERRLDRYRDLARHTGLGERIRFVEPDESIEQYYHALDVYVHPALFEEFGQSVQEAMACGVPVVTSRRVGATELYGPEADAFVLDAPDADALAAAMTRFVGDSALRRHVAEIGRRACRANSWDENFRRHLELYEHLIAERCRARGP